MSESRLPIVVDTPAHSTADGHRAGLGFERYVDGIAAAIRGGNPPRYTIGLFGPWGSGKSTLLNGIAAKLQETDGDSVIVVPFDAWRYQSSGSLVFALLQAVRRRVEDRPYMSATVTAISAVLDRFEVSFLGVGLKYQRREPNSNEQYITPFDNLTKLSSTLDGRRIVVFVDDLDRCTPTSIVNIIEAIHLLTDVEGFIFVLALDYDFLTTAIKNTYPNIEADRFVEKIVQIPFRIPSVSVEEKDIQELLPEWDTRLSPWFEGVSAAELTDIIYLALRSNPRQMKRLVNTFLLAQHMAGRVPEPLTELSDSDRKSAKLVLHLLALQLAWPAQFQDLTRAVRDALRNREAESLGELGVFQGLVEPDESEDLRSAQLGQFLKSTFQAETSLDELVPAMDLTSSVTISPVDDRRPEDDDGSERRHDQVVAEAPDELRAVFADLQSFATSLDASTRVRVNKSYISITRETETFKNRVFAALEMGPDRVMLNIPTSWASLPPELQQWPVYEMVSARGPVALRVHPRADAELDLARRLIEFSFRSVVRGFRR